MTAAPIPTCTEHVDALVAERLRAVLSALLREVSDYGDAIGDNGYITDDVGDMIRRHAAAAGITLDGE